MFSVSEVIDNEDLKKAEKRNKEFNEKFKKITQRIDNIKNHELFDYENMQDGELINIESITSMRAGIETIFNYVTREFHSLESDWILDIFVERFKEIENDFQAFDSALKANLKNNNISHIGYDPNSLTFNQYFDRMVQKVDHLRYSLEYLLRLNSNLKNDANKVLLLSNNELVEGLKKAKLSLEKEVEDFRKSRAISENAKTEDIYDKAVKKYRKYEWINRSVFLILLGLVILISLIFWDSDYLNNIINEPTYAKSAIFWSVKITSLIAGVTLITYFLKQSSHYQRLADQNYQTQLELQAYPSFMESINIEEASSVRKELALKYFGREIDGAAHKDMSNLISDQMKSTTEMVKATTEAIKNLKQ